MSRLASPFHSLAQCCMYFTLAAHLLLVRRRRCAIAIQIHIPQTVHKMSNQSISSSCVMLPCDHKVIRAFGCELIIHLSAAETGGKYTMFTSVQAPGVGPPPHY